MFPYVILIDFFFNERDAQLPVALIALRFAYYYFLELIEPTGTCMHFLPSALLKISRK